MLGKNKQTNKTTENEKSFKTESHGLLTGQWELKVEMCCGWSWSCTLMLILLFTAIGMARDKQAKGAWFFFPSPASRCPCALWVDRITGQQHGHRPPRCFTCGSAPTAKPKPKGINGKGTGCRLARKTPLHKANEKQPNAFAVLLFQTGAHHVAQVSPLTHHPPSPASSVLGWQM